MAQKKVMQLANEERKKNWKCLKYQGELWVLHGLYPLECSQKAPEYIKRRQKLDKGGNLGKCNNSVKMLNCDDFLILSKRSLRVFMLVVNFI